MMSDCRSGLRTSISHADIKGTIYNVKASVPSFVGPLSDNVNISISSMGGLTKCKDLVLPP